jgi:predicted DCC family thiol-disulfide oxidoreductase YuxK
MPATLIYDGQCPLCRRWASRLQAFAGESRLSLAALDDPGAMELHRDLSYAKALKAVQLVLENGRLCDGAEAGFQAIALRPGWGFLAWFYYLPPLRQIFDLIYRYISRNRNRCPSCEH